MGRGGGKWRDRVEGGGFGGGRDGGWEMGGMGVYTYATGFMVAAEDGIGGVLMRVA